jgi:fermentation-respiration switch protein FrsA (DUF1100 family)
LEAHHDIKAAVLKAPAVDWGEARGQRLGEAAMKQWRETGYHDFEYPPYLTVRTPYSLYEDILKYDAYAGAGDISCPLIAFHGDKDTSVPVGQSEKLVQLIGSRAKFRLLPGADHRFSDSDDFETYASETVDFLASQLL